MLTQQDANELASWKIPTKTFLLGEYAALAEKSAIILTTSPYFEVSLIDREGLVGIHPSSPAGLLWQKNKITGHGLQWKDPYQGIGGLGASSAQFIGSYLAICYLKKRLPSLEKMIEAYYESAWLGKGLKPSGYDVIAQSQFGLVYINKEKKLIKTYRWPFSDLRFFLIHTGVKLATHEHLQTTVLPQQMDNLADLVDEAKHAFMNRDSAQLIESINRYHQQLMELNLVAPHSQELLARLRAFPEVITAKGCGALGADILLVLVAKHDAKSLRNQLNLQKWKILAEEENLTDSNKNSLINNLQGKIS